MAVFTLLYLGTDRSQEGLEVSVKVLWGDAQIPVQKEEELLLHEVHLSDREAEALETTNGRITSPMLVLGRRVVEVLCGKDEGGKEDAVYCTAHAFSNRRKTLLQTG